MAHMATRAARPRKKQKPLVGIIMGSQSDWETMSAAAKIAQELGIPYEAKIVSAHRTPERMFAYAAAAQKRGLQAIIAGAGMAAHLPGMTASLTLLPVFGVPVESKSLKGIDSLLSIAQMPRGIPVGTLSIGHHGAANAMLLAARMLALRNKKLARRLQRWCDELRASVADEPKDQPQPKKQ